MLRAMTTLSILPPFVGRVYAKESPLLPCAPRNYKVEQGPYRVVIEGDDSLPHHAIFRPSELSMAAVWMMAPPCVFYLLELASHGYIVIIKGGIKSDPGKQPLDLKAPPAGDFKSGPPMSPTIDAIDWALEQNADSVNPLNGKLKAGAVAPSGGSCGGLQALSIAIDDPRVATVVILDSVFFKDARQGGEIIINQTARDRLHTPLLYILGGPTDIAYANGMDDFARISKVPFVAAKHRESRPRRRVFR